MGIDNFQNRGSEVMIPHYKSSAIGGFSVESIQYHLGGTFRGDYYTLNDNIINGRIRGIAGVVGCNNAPYPPQRSPHQSGQGTHQERRHCSHTGCNGIACAMEGLLTPEAAAVHCGPGLAEVCEVVGIPPVLHMGSCVDNSGSFWRLPKWVKAGGLGKDISELPLAGSAPEWMSEKAISIGHYFVASGVYTVFGLHLPTSGAPVFHDYLSKELEKLYGGKWDLEADPIKHAQLMIAHIDKKRKELGIDRARSVCSWIWPTVRRWRRNRVNRFQTINRYKTKGLRLEPLFLCVIKALSGQVRAIACRFYDNDNFIFAPHPVPIPTERGNVRMRLRGRERKGSDHDTTPPGSHAPRGSPLHRFQENKTLSGQRPFSPGGRRTG